MSHRLDQTRRRFTWPPPPAAPPASRSSTTRACDLLAAQEEERGRIAIELHDSTCQHLAALNLSLGRLRPLVSGDKANEVLEDMAASVGEVTVMEIACSPT